MAAADARHVLRELQRLHDRALAEDRPLVLIISYEAAKRHVAEL